MRLYYCDHYAIPLPAGHKFPMRKYSLVRDELLARGGFEFHQAAFADPLAIELVHDSGYVRRFLEGSLQTSVIRRIGFPWSEGLVRRTLASVGGTLSAAADALRFGFGGNLAGGTHHAFRTEGAGFCVFNDIAVAIHWLRAQGRIRRAAVVDLDVHQGDGTAAIFADDPEVFTLSLHGRNNFPLRKQTSRLDIGFGDGTGDEEYLTILRRVLPMVFDFKPDVVFYQTGVDALASDRLGLLSLTHEGLLARDQLVFENCRSRGIPVIASLGGGYSEPIEQTVRAHAGTFRTAQRIFSELTVASLGGNAGNLQTPTVQKLQEPA